MSEPHDNDTGVPPTSDVKEGVRLELRPDFPRTGLVDGGWWPRSRDLRAELPGLVAAIDLRIGTKVGQVLRLGFRRTEWDPVEKQRIATPTGRVALSGWNVFEPDLVWVISRSTSVMPVALVVVPPETPHEHAVAVLRRAGDARNTEGPAELLGPENAVDQEQPGGSVVDDGGEPHPLHPHRIDSRHHLPARRG